MKYSYNWLKELTKTEKNPTELAEMVGLRGFELEEIESLKERFKDFVIGEVISSDNHPNADRLQFVKVDIGGKQIAEIVCGAENFKEGDKVPVALPGSILPQNKLKIEKREVRGVVSNGMICAEDELGLGKDHSGIMVLGDDAKSGQPIGEFLGLEDDVIDFDILPDRAHDCLSYEGMAREICAMEGKKLEKHDSQVEEKETDELKISIEDSEGCSRYIGAILENVKIGSSPDWMKARLVASGMEPINNVVDITNYVMLEIGNPLHAFDYSKIEESGNEIVVRRAKKGEQLELLDETKLELDEKDLVIAGKEKPLALAGIKGGKDSGINEDTTKIVLESANFNGFGIRMSRQKHALLTEAQARFEKGISPALAKKAILRAIELLCEHTGASLVGVVDEDMSEERVQKVSFDFALIANLLGHNIEKEEALKILNNLGFETKGDEDVVEVIVPHWRLDIEGPEDLVEEVARIVGYEKIDENPILTPIGIAKKNTKRQFEWNLKDILVGGGFSEVRNYSFYGAKDIKNCSLGDEHFEIENPLSEELGFLRKTLVPGLLKNVAHNVKFFEEISIFEVGRTYFPKKQENPEEKNFIAAAFVNASLKKDDLLFSLKGQLEALLETSLGVQVFFEEESEKEEIFHHGRIAKIILDLDDRKVQIGVIGEAHSIVLKKYAIKQPVAIFELDMDILAENSKSQKVFQPLRKYPTAGRDLSFYVDNKKKVQEILSVIKKAGNEDLVEVNLFDVYVDRESGKKSLAFHLKFGNNDRTLTNKEVDEMLEKIVKQLEEEGAELRVG